jgi:Putative peptidoglycan binding domain
VLLKFKPFAASADMKRAAMNKPPLTYGAHGPAVALLQGALIDMGLKMPKSTRAGVPDGIFGHETQQAVKAFQSKKGLPADGIAGGTTVSALDATMAAKVPPSIATPPSPPAAAVPRFYRIGSSDPSVPTDPGAGPWRSKPVTAVTVALKVTILMRLNEVSLLVGKDAAKHMAHYLENSGADYVIDLESMVRDVPSAKLALADEIQQAQAFVEGLAPGRYEITSTEAEEGYNDPNENRNWYYATGGYWSWGKGVATVVDRSGRCEYVLDYEYKVFDRYNWDGGKAVELFHITITDEFMGEFHRQGLAREYSCHGSLKRTLTWRQGERIHVHLKRRGLLDRL